MQLEKDAEQERRLLALPQIMVGILSQDIKPHLRTIQGYAEDMQKETDDSEKLECAQYVISGVDQINSLTASLVELMNLNSEDAHLLITQFDFVELAETMVRRLLIDIPDANFKLNHKLPEQKVFVKTDQQRMEQVLRHLITSARENVLPGAVLQLEASVDKGALHFSIFNECQPIPQRVLSQLWSPLYWDINSEYNNFGMGLSIVGQILSKQNYPYGAESMKNGVRIWFSIPVAE